MMMTMMMTWYSDGDNDNDDYNVSFTFIGGLYLGEQIKLSQVWR